MKAAVLLLAGATAGAVGMVVGLAAWAFRGTPRSATDARLPHP